MFVFDTAIGPCGLAWSDRGVTDVFVAGDRAIRDAEPASPESVPPFVRDAAAGIQALLAGERLDLGGIVIDLPELGDFTRAVLDATRAVPPGQTTTYGAIARLVGTPNDARAVGAALGSNPVPIIIPCHRVLAADGALTGFSAPGGIKTKRTMLEIERAPGFDQPSLFG